MKHFFVHGGFAVLIIFINLCFGAVLWVPYALTALGVLHVWNIIFGGPAVIGNDGPMPNILGAVLFLFCAGLAVLANYGARSQLRAFTKDSGVLPRWFHSGIAIGAALIGMDFTSSVIFGRETFFLL